MGSLNKPHLKEILGKEADPLARILSVCVYIQNMPGEFAPVHSGYCASLQALQ